MVLSHTNSIIMHTNMMHVHGLARLHLQSPNRTHRLSNALVQPWADASECTITERHANKIIKLAKGISCEKRTRDKIEISRQDKVVPISRTTSCCNMYVLRIPGHMGSNRTNEDSTDRAAVDILERGFNLLSCFRVRVADALKNVLCHYIRKIREVLKTFVASVNVSCLSRLTLRSLLT